MNSGFRQNSVLELRLSGGLSIVLDVDFEHPQTTMTRP